MLTIGVGNQVVLGGHDQSNIAKLNGRPFPVGGLDAATLSATWVFIPARNSWLKSWSSSFILNVDGTPFVRLEVDMFKPEGSWLQAHIQVTAESRLLGYLRGVQKQKRTRLHQLHLPVGGFRFRPGIEDFAGPMRCRQLTPVKGLWGLRLRWRLGRVATARSSS